jgi:addiction module RelB/DinJ family antitoxin
MSLLLRTETLRARVYPQIKYASEDVLHRIGLNLSGAIELFLRRVIIDQKLPFEVEALDDATLTAVTQAWEKHARQHDKGRVRTSKQPGRQKRE